MCGIGPAEVRSEALVVIPRHVSLVYYSIENIALVFGESSRHAVEDALELVSTVVTVLYTDALGK